MVFRELQGQCASLLTIALSFAAVVVFSLPSSQSFAADGAEKRIVMIGLDASSNSITVPVPASLYRQKLSVALSSVHDSMAPVLLRREGHARSE